MAQVLKEGVEYHFFSAAMLLNQQDYPVPSVVTDAPGGIQKCRQITKRPVQVSPEPSFMLTTVSCTTNLAYLYVVKDESASKRTRTWSKLHTGRRLFMTVANIYGLISVPGYVTGLRMNPLAVSLLEQLNTVAIKPLTSATVTQLLHISDQIHSQILISKLDSQLVMANARVKPTGARLQFLSLISFILGGDIFPVMTKEQAGTLLTVYLLLIFNILLIIITYISRRCPCGSPWCTTWKSGCCRTC